MRQGQISIYYGMGKGKTAVAVGRGMRAIGEEQRVVMIQFLDYHNSKEIALLKKLEPDFRIFRFEKDRAAEDVQGAENDEALHKEIFNEIRNAFNFAKKIVDTGECEMLLLDGILECVEKGYLQESDLHEIIGKRPDFMDIILTGTILPAGIAGEAENIYQLVAEKELQTQKLPAIPRPKPALKFPAVPTLRWMIYISRRTSSLLIMKMHGTKYLA